MQTKDLGKALKQLELLYNAVKEIRIRTLGLISDIQLQLGIAYNSEFNLIFLISLGHCAAVNNLTEFHRSL